MFTPCSNPSQNPACMGGRAINPATGIPYPTCKACAGSPQVVDKPASTHIPPCSNPDRNPACEKVRLFSLTNGIVYPSCRPCMTYRRLPECPNLLENPDCHGFIMHADALVPTYRFLVPPSCPSCTKVNEKRTCRNPSNNDGCEGHKVYDEKKGRYLGLCSSCFKVNLKCRIPGCTNFRGINRQTGSRYEYCAPCSFK